MIDARDLALEAFAVDEQVLVDLLADAAIECATFRSLAERFLRELVLERVRSAEAQRQIRVLMGVPADEDRL